MQILRSRFGVFALFTVLSLSSLACGSPDDPHRDGGGDSDGGGNDPDGGGNNTDGGGNNTDGGGNSRCEAASRSTGVCVTDAESG